MCRRANDAQTPAALPRVRFPSPPHSKICPRLSRPRSPTWPLSLSPRPTQTPAPLAPRRRMQEGKFGRPHARSSFQAGATPRRVRQDWTTDASRRKGKFTPRCGGRHGRHRCGPSTEGQHARRGKAGKGTRAERGGGGDVKRTRTGGGSRRHPPPCRPARGGGSPRRRRRGARGTHPRGAAAGPGGRRGPASCAWPGRSAGGARGGQMWV